MHPDVAVCFFRIAQESLRNGIVHGGAKHLAVTLNRSGDQLDLAVVDDGRGFDVNAVQSNGSGGLGLVTMEERVNLVGGDYLHRQRARPRHDGESARRRESTAG